MDPFLLSIATGLSLGIASTLHCAGMCGAISSGLMLATKDASARPRAFAMIHVGRLLAYALAGGAIAAVGSPLIGWLDRELAFRLAQWAAAIAVMWIGLSTAGLLPPLTWVDRALAPVTNALSRATQKGSRRSWTPFALGFAWGTMPCAMVYGALFTAMLTGSASAGATTMLAFGAGTLPGLAAAALGFGWIARTGLRRERRVAAGLAIAALGAMTVWLPRPGSDIICAVDQPTQVVEVHHQNASAR